MTKKVSAISKRVCGLFLAVLLISLIPMNQAHAVSANGAMAKGIDVSKHNGTVNWGAVVGAGMNFAFIKVGSTYSGIDPQFAANITTAQAAGLKTGVYIYSYAVTPDQAVNEANLVLQWIDPYTVNYPVVFDIEDKCHKSLSNQQLIDIINSFCSTIDAAGYYPMVYSNKNMFEKKLSICGWDKWVAQYNSSCDYNNNVCFWQYSGSGTINGMGGRVDLNYQYKDYSQLIIPEGFIAHNDTVRFYRNWRMQRGWVGFNDTKYFLDGAGNLVRGWFTDEVGTYYLTPADGSIARGQCNIDGADFYFTADGVKSAGWITVNDMTYFYEPANNGILKREWFSDEKGNCYYFDKADGHMLTGAQIIDGAEFLFTAEGIRQTGFVAREDASTYYYDPATGAKMTGWIVANNQTYYGDEAGHIVTGAFEINKQVYYFDATGALVRNQPLELNGIQYITSPDGILVEVVPEPAPTEAPVEASGTAQTAQPAATAK